MEIVLTHKCEEQAYIQQKKEPSGKSVLEILASVFYYRSGYDVDKV